MTHSFVCLLYTVLTRCTRNIQVKKIQIPDIKRTQTDRQWMSVIVHIHKYLRTQNIHSINIFPKTRNTSREENLHLTSALFHRPFFVSFCRSLGGGDPFSLSLMFTDLSLSQFPWRLDHHWRTVPAAPTDPQLLRPATTGPGGCNCGGTSRLPQVTQAYSVSNYLRALFTLSTTLDKLLIFFTTFLAFQVNFRERKDSCLLTLGEFSINLIWVKTHPNCF